MELDRNQGAWPDEEPRLSGRWVAIVASIILLFIGGFSVLCIGGVSGAIALFSRFGLHPDDLMAGMTGDVMALTFFMGFGSFAVLGLLFMWLLGWKPKYALALRAAPWATLIVATLGGVTVGVFPGWIAEQLYALFPELADQGTLELIPRLLSEGSWFDRTAMVATIVIGAPLLEEVCFRGLLWNAVERIAPGRTGQLLAMVLTSLAFILAHADPVQSPALIFTAFFLGWLRLTSGSIWPGIIAHFVNNGLAAILTIMSIQYEWESGSSSTGLAIGAAIVTIGMAALLWPFRRTPDATPEAAWDAMPALDPFDEVPTDPAVAQRPAV